MSSLRVAITGARGYLGSTLARHFQAGGSEVAAWHRSAEAGACYKLGGGLGSLDWENIGAVVHCAYDFRARGREEIHRINVEGSLELLRETVSRRARFVFISSMSCYDGCQSLYGQAKLEVENEVLAAGGTVIRPGLIYGNPPGGLFATLCRAARALPVLPMIGMGNFPQYLAHDGCLARLVADVALGRLVLSARPHSAAHPQKILFRDLLRRIVAIERRRGTIFFPIPWRAIYAAMACAERAGLRLGFRADSLIGLVRANPSPAFDLPEGYFPRPFPAGLTE
ncbi:MAG: NAD-dependent epimerase/dehydratase family protein [Verrucomicrobiae bacterium]